MASFLLTSDSIKEILERNHPFKDFVLFWLNIVIPCFFFYSERRKVKDVGFLAYPKNNFNTTDREPVIFDGVIRNTGNGYDNRTGIFTVPVAGVYHIYFNLLADDEGVAAEIDILINNTIVPARAWIEQSKYYWSASASAYARLSKADTVHLYAYHTGGIIYRKKYSTFGCELIKN